MDPQSGFCPSTKAFLSLRPAVSLPPPSLPLSYTSFALSNHPPSSQSSPALIDAVTGASLSFASFTSRVYSLASILRSSHGLSRGQVAFVISPASVDLPVLYFALLAIGVTVAPANPASTPSELARLARLATPSIVFVHSSVAPNLPPTLPVLLLDSLTFRSSGAARIPAVPVAQSDTAAILFSSGTTGRTKAAAIAHRSFIAMTAGNRALRPLPGGGGGSSVTLLPAPMFHSLGFFFALNSLALGDTLVLMDRPTFPEIMRAAERYGVSEIVAAPPVVFAMARPGPPNLPKLERVICGGAPLPAEAGKRFQSKFPGVLLCQGYGSTEAGGISRMIDAEECQHQKAAGRLNENVEGKIISTLTGEPLSVGQPGELWLRGPALMKGYVGDEEANENAFDAEGWLKTGDLCYFDENGYLYVVDRLKELIKYKAYQVPPAELEHILQSMPEIIDAAVIPFPQEEVGQIPVAFVVRHPGSTITEADVMNYVAEQVAPYKRIRKVSFVKSIPKSVSGKILRRELASTYAEPTDVTLFSRI